MDPFFLLNTDTESGISALNDEYKIYLHPMYVRQVTKIAEDFCDKLDSDTSFMYDEFPDREYLNVILTGLHKELSDKLIDIPDHELPALCLVADAAFIGSMYLRRRKHADDTSLNRSPVWNKN